MYELLSKRIKNADGEPEVFTYNSFPQAFRNQVFYFLEDVLEPYSTYSENLWDRKVWDMVNCKMVMENPV